MSTGISQVVKFDDGDMQVRVQNKYGSVGEVSTCFEASPETITAKCPQGYAQLYVTINGNQPELNFWVSKNGLMLRNPEYVIEGTIKFREDGSIKVLVAEQPKLMTVSLINANIYVPKEPETTKPPKQSYRMLYLVLLGLALVVVTIIIAAVVWYCCCYKSSTSRSSTLNQSIRSPQRH